ncbi:MAG: FlgD immunoglobulin-like domain containing protein [Candidatus Cloacimonas sp.]|jgi:hypothetical protein|nr:FlgD immunoglobulin-like domain containing protein [Candidatus Cloacimonas sp.]
MKFIALFVVITVCSVNLLAQIAIPPSMGSGSEENPYQISSLGQLYWIASDNSNLGYNYAQTQNIDATSSASWFPDGIGGFGGWRPIGLYVGNTNPANAPFTGKYNGNGYVIDGIYTNRSDASGIGLFGFTYGAEITNLSVINVNIFGDFDFTGGLVGYNNTTPISNCFSSGTVTGSYHCGGLIGINLNSGINNCFSNASVSGHIYSGGLIGNNRLSNINNCYSRGDVTRTEQDSEIPKFGGLVGSNYQSAIEHCYSTGSVYYEEFADPTDQGFIGSNENGTYISNYFDSEASNQDSSIGATPQTTAQMKTLNTFVGWDFIDTWQFVDNVNDGYPSLQSANQVASEDDIAPATVALCMMAYPNPFMCNTTVSYKLSQSAQTELNIYNIRGQLVRKLVNEPLSSGQHTVTWDGKDDNGKPLASGMYLCRIISAGKQETHKMLLMK